MRVITPPRPQVSAIGFSIQVFDCVTAFNSLQINSRKHAKLEKLRARPHLHCIKLTLFTLLTLFICTFLFFYKVVTVQGQLHCSRINFFAEKRNEETLRIHRSSIDHRLYRYSVNGVFISLELVPSVFVF